MEFCMNENFREFLERLRAAQQLIDIRQPVDIRHVGTLVDQSDKALLFHNVIGYDMPLLSGIIRTQERAMMAMGCDSYSEIEKMLAHGIQNPIPPKYVATSATKEVIYKGDDVDLFRLPIPRVSMVDLGPMITA